MYYSIQSLQLLKRFFADSFIVGLASRIDFIILYTVVLKAFAFFLYSIFITTMYQKKVSAFRYALSALLFTLLSVSPLFSTFLALPHAVTYQFEVFFVVDPPYFIPIIYLLFVYILKIDKSLVLAIVFKLYLVVVANVLCYYTFEALFAFLLANETPYIQTAFFASNVVMFLINIVLLFWLLPLIRRRKLWLDAYKLRQPDVRVKRTLWKYVLYSTLLFVPSSLLVKYFGGQRDVVFIVIGQLLLIAICAMSFFASYWRDLRRIMIVDMSNKDVYVHSLVTSIEDSRKLWHDMNNMLQVYDGYIKVGNYEKLKEYHQSLYSETRVTNDMMDINAKYESNPALFAVLAAKISQARQDDIHINCTCTADASLLCIEPRDLSRIVGILLDNALEESIEARSKSIHFSLEETHGNRLLMSITNQTRADIDVKHIIDKRYTTKENHDGYGLHNLWSIVRRTENCRLNVEYANRYITFYVELPCHAPTDTKAKAAVGAIP